MKALLVLSIMTCASLVGNAFASEAPSTESNHDDTSGMLQVRSCVDKLGIRELSVKQGNVTIGDDDVEVAITLILKRATLISIILLLLVSCGNKKEKAVIRNDVLSHAEMVKLIADVHIVEAVIEERRNSGQLKPGEMKLFYDQVFEKYHLNKEMFYKNINYYLEKPQEFLKIYDEAIIELSKKQGAAIAP